MARVLNRYYFVLFLLIILQTGAKGDWDFRISDLVQNPEGTDIQPLWWISVQSGGRS